MTSGRSARTRSCDAHDAQVRLSHAQSFLTVAELVVDTSDPDEYGNAAASLAVLAGIAASDAACCAALGRRSRSENHLDAVGLLGEVRPRGADAAKYLRRLLSLKDQAEYGVMHLGVRDLQGATRSARQLVEFAERVVRL